ncbi:restriction endonuclease subunit S [Sphingobacterium sp. WM]|uniref:restriction endonuclease subunit S n=1 Tax=Sphingobacterium sp. WM TaxID=3031802 RepID=UPI00240E6FDB|nr:restriction endonuclease subunit S [Sphingobacterium sp. WM]WFB64999.1 restriction endonuclease subunit S [Sphingobacterium sp. WM]
MWEKVKLGTLCKMNSGGTPSRSKAAYYENGDIPWVKISDIENAIGGIIYDTEEKITTEGLKSINNRIFKPGTLLLAMYGSVGKVAFIKKEMSTNQAILGINILRTDLLSYKYLKLWFTTIKENLSNRAVGGVLKNISLGIVKDLEIPLPPLQIQERIAEILDKADELRRKDKDLQEKYDQLAKAIFIDMFGDPVKNDKGWEKGTIRDLVQEVKYGTSSPAEENGSYPYLRMNNITYEGYWDFSNLKYINATDTDYAKYGLEYNDLIFNRTNSKELVGKTALYKSSERVIIAGYLIRVRVNSLAHPDYISAYLNSSHGKKTLANMCKNIVGQANINAQELQDIKILIPPLYLQEEFAKKIELINELKAKVNAEKSEELFQSLLQKAFKGELVS